jgi:hypothetical protein
MGSFRARVPHRLCIAGASLLLIALALSACGKGSLRTSRSRSPSSSADRTATQGSDVSASEVSVIKGWSDALRDGHPQRAAAYWAHPSVMVNGLSSSGQLALIHIRSAHDALIADETLPCGATLRSTSRRGAYVQADFTLGARSGAPAGSSGCSGPARVDFLIRDARIVRWLRAPLTSAPPPGGGESSGEGASSQSI